MPGRRDTCQRWARRGPADDTLAMEHKIEEALPCLVKEQETNNRGQKKKGAKSRRTKGENFRPSDRGG